VTDGVVGLAFLCFWIILQISFVIYAYFLERGNLSKLNLSFTEMRLKGMLLQYEGENTIMFINSENTKNLYKHVKESYGTNERAEVASNKSISLST
jgi:hypothetical protein